MMLKNIVRNILSDFDEYKQEKMKQKNIKLYNLILPIWFLLWIPSYLWAIVIPANYVIDRLVFTISAKKMKKELGWKFFRRHTWKLWLIGFGCDLIGVLIMGGALFGSGLIDNAAMEEIVSDFQGYLMVNALKSPLSLLVTLIAIAVSGFFIYFFDKKVIFATKEFTVEEAKKIALFMAIFTAPYLYLVPIEPFWNMF